MADCHEALSPLRRSHHLEWWLGVLFLVVALGLTGVGLLYWNQQQVDARSVAHAELETIADLKVQQLVNWHNERLSDGRFFLQAPFVARDVARLLAAPEDEAAEAEPRHWLTLLKAGQRYERVTIFDSQLSPRLSIPPWTNDLAPGLRSELAAALRTDRVILTDLQRDDPAGEVHLDLLIPVFPPGDPASGDARIARNAAAPFGVILLQMNPRHFLYPLVQTWPTSSPTAETLLVRREGDEVLFLSEPRHQAGAAMTLRRSLNEARLPAARGALREIGVREGVDYRGVRVLAAVRPVPDTAWVMVAKVDEAELYAPLRRQAWSMGTVAVLLFLAAGLGLTVLWRRRNERFLHAQLAAEREARASAERFEHLMRHASDVIVLADAQWRILEANDRALQAYGWTLEELQGKTLPDLRTPEARAEFPSQVEALGERGWVLFETVHQRKDGTAFPVEVSASRVEIGGVPFTLSLTRDITQRKAHEAGIERLNRLYAMLSEVNQTIVGCQAREELFAEICRVTLQIGRFKAAWIGWKSADREGLTPVAHQASGLEPGREMPGWQSGCGVSAEAVRTGRPCLCNGSQADPRTAGCRDLLAGQGVQACAAFPLRLRGEVCGAFHICSIEPDFFNVDETRLLEEVASDISFALDRLDEEAKRRRTERELQRQTEEVRARNEELTRFNRAAVDRELRMIELKREVDELCRRLGDPPRFGT